MNNKYLSFVSDDHLFECIRNLHRSYSKAKSDITKQKFYANKIDSIKFIFDSKFNNLNEISLIQTEILRQIDKSINNSIGTFHEQILGGVSGYERGQNSGFDIKATDNSLFADIKNKHNTMNSSASESLYQKLAGYANTYKQAKCYWVQILAKGSFHENWSGIINGKEYNHSRVYKISGDRFYALLTGEENAFLNLYNVLPNAISDYMKEFGYSEEVAVNSAIQEINEDMSKTGRSMLDQITFENFSYYLGFDKL
jgi:Eco47II restriction endonuclease